uniref:Uncharacterized protein n=1 Tax=Oncorhynchus kisutch TaxID=8019 RepID=A0A8C7JX94_ONCKI
MRARRLQVGVAYSPTPCRTFGICQRTLRLANSPLHVTDVTVLDEFIPSRYVLYVLLQHHFLSWTSASFSENLYSLKCVAASGHEWTSHLGLRWKQHWRSLVLLGLAPYLGAFLAAYPYVSMGWNSCVFCQQLLYMFDRAKTHSPLLWLAGVRLAHLTGHDITNMDLKPATPSMTIGSSVSTPLMPTSLPGASDRQSRSSSLQGTISYNTTHMGTTCGFPCR